MSKASVKAIISAAVRGLLLGASLVFLALFAALVALANIG